MLGEIIEQNRLRKPLIHCITNYVTANDCANILLASGGSAVMADDPEETAEITNACNGLVINIGTPNPRRLQGMLNAGIAANRVDHPVVLDPVGAGGSAMRRNAVNEMLRKVRFAAIRGNVSEIAALSTGIGSGRGVDAEPECIDNESAAIANARTLSRKTGAVVIVTGDTDIVTDGNITYRVFNGHPMMRTITGTGCQMSALLGAYVTSNPNNVLHAALAAVCTMGYCGETAYTRLTDMDGNASYRNYIIDAVYRLTSHELDKGARYEIC